MEAPLQRMACLALLLAAFTPGPAARADDQLPIPPLPIPPPTSSVQKVAPETAEAILGARVSGPDGKDIGRLVDVLVDDNGQPQAAIIDFGGFMGVGNRKVAVHWSAVHFNPAAGRNRVAVDMTPDQIRDAPEYSNSDKPAPVVTPADSSPQVH
jgi:hypothetical protein